MCGAGTSSLVPSRYQKESAALAAEGGKTMYGLIAKITTIPGKRDEMIALLKTSAAGMPGCLRYVVANDSANENILWVTEVWDTLANHDASLSLPQAKKRHPTRPSPRREFRKNRPVGNCPYATGHRAGMICAAGQQGTTVVGAAPPHADLRKAHIDETATWGRGTRRREARFDDSDSGETHSA
jgi:quinol monooxygenase YgiN